MYNERDRASRRRQRWEKVWSWLWFVLVVLIVAAMASCYVYVGLNEEEPIDCDALYEYRLDAATTDEEYNFWSNRYFDCIDSE